MTDSLLSAQLYSDCLSSLEPSRLLANQLAVEVVENVPVLRLKGRTGP
jgi:hypothetical protein